MDKNMNENNEESLDFMMVQDFDSYADEPIKENTEVQVETAPYNNAKQKNVKPKKKERATSTKGHYVTNAQILEAFYDAKEKNELTKELARCLTLVAERYSYHPWFAGYSFREDLVATAVVVLCANWHKFDPTKYDNPNPFSYYTTTCYRAFMSFLGEEKKEREIKDELLVDAGSNPSFGYQARSGISGKTSDDAFMGSSADD